MMKNKDTTFNNHEDALVQYFYIIGINNNKCANQNTKILNKYPQCDFDYYSINEDIIINVIYNYI